MTKALENLNGTDAQAFRGALSPHVLAILQDNSYPSFDQLYAALTAMGRYRATLAQGVADYPVPELFSTDEGGTLAIYRRIAAPPGYEYYDSLLTADQASAFATSAEASADQAGAAKDGAAASAALADGKAQAAASSAALAQNAKDSVQGVAKAYIKVFPDRNYSSGVVDKNFYPVLATRTSGPVVGSAAPKSPYIKAFPDRGYLSGRLDANGYPLSAVPSNGGPPVGSEQVAAVSIIKAFPDRAPAYLGANVLLDANLRPISGMPTSTRVFVDSDGIYLDSGTVDVRIAQPLGTILYEGGVSSGLVKWRDKVAGVRKRRQFAVKPVPNGLSASLTKLMILPNYGQSLSNGTNARGVYTTSAIAMGRALMSNAGPRPVLGGLGYGTVADTSWDHQYLDENTALTDDRMTTLTDLVEQYKPSEGIGETQMSGQVYWLAKTGNVEATTGFISGSLGVGGCPIALLQKGGSQAYTNLILWIERQVAHARWLGLTPEIPGILFDQGESNWNSSTWLADVLTLQDNLNTDIQAIMGDTIVRPLIIWQPSSWTKFSVANAPATALAMVTAAMTYPTRIRLIGPQYWCSYFYTDGVHMLARGYRLCGEYGGRELLALRNSTASGAFYATAATYSSGVLTVTMNRAVTLDTTLVSDPGQYGLDLLAADGTTNIALSSISVSGSTITATPATAPTVGAKVGIARLSTVGNAAGPTTGLRSCFRDASTDLAGDGTTHLYNWACHQQIALS